jgi:O-antigen/teichoic acid export membrane protein
MILMEKNQSHTVTQRDSLKKSSFFNILMKFVIYLIPLITTPYLYRTLTVAGVGTFSYQYAYVTYFMLVALFGFNEYGTKEISSVSDDKAKMSERFWSIFSAQLVMGVGCLLVYFILVFCHVFGDASENLSYCLLSLFIIGNTMDITFFYQGIEKFQSIAIRTLLIKVLNLAFIFIFVHSASDYLPYVAIMSISWLLSNGIMFIPLFKYINKPTFKNVFLFKDIRNSAIFFVSALAITLYSTFGKTILGLLYDNTQVGYFESATKIRDVINSVAFAVVPVVFSRNTYLITAGRKEEAKELLYKTFNATMDFVLPATVGLVCTASVFVPWFFGTEDAPAIPMMIIIAFVIPLVSTTRILDMAYYLPNGKMKTVNIVLVSVAAVSLAMNYLMIKYIGPNGAAWATLATEFLSAVFFLFFCRKEIDIRRIFKSLIKPFDAALIMGIVYYLISTVLASHSAKLVMVIDVIVCVLLYGTLLLLFKDDFLYPQFIKYKTAFKSKLASKKAKKKE